MVDVVDIKRKRRFPFTYLSFKVGRLIRVRSQVGCYAYKIADPVKCHAAAMSAVISQDNYRFECGCVLHERISLKGGQIGLAVRYTERKVNISHSYVAALFDEQLILAIAVEFDEVSAT